MGQTNYLKLFSAVAFVAFAAVSCWATVESLHVWQPSIPPIGLWIFTIGTYVIASLGTKWLVEGMRVNQVYVDHTKLRIFGGLLLILLFWIIYSLPTNTHTFYYHEQIKSTIKDDLDNTEKLLKSLNNDELANEQLQQGWDSFRASIKNLEAELTAEVNHTERPGVGEHVENILLRIEQKLNEVKASENDEDVHLLRMKPTANSTSAWNEVVKKYQSQIEIIMEGKFKIYQDKYIGINDKQTKKSFTDHLNNITKLKGAIYNMTTIDNDVILAANNEIENARKLIKQYSDKIKTADRNQASQVTNTAKLLDTYGVWNDFFKGNHQTLSFLTWIMIAFLLDLSSFIFFDIAFCKRN